MQDCLSLILGLSAKRKRLRYEIVHFSLGLSPSRIVSLENRIRVLDVELGRLRGVLKLFLL